MKSIPDALGEIAGRLPNPDSDRLRAIAEEIQKMGRYIPDFEQCRRAHLRILGEESFLGWEINERAEYGLRVLAELTGSPFPDGDLKEADKTEAKAHFEAFRATDRCDI